jgi:23S rRNA pseudouridine955/2504/2580 synthase
LHHLVAGIHNAGRRIRFASARVNSGKSNTYIANVVQRIIGGKPADKAKAVRASGPRAVPTVTPAVMRVQIDEGSEGQRLDNFLLKLLKGVPKTHVYRVIRSGEVRVNKGRAAADTRLVLGDEVRVPPVRVADRSAEPPAPAREFPVVFEDEHLIVVDKPARPSRCTAAAASASASSSNCVRRGLRRNSSSSCIAWTRRPPACCSSPRSARR